MDKHDLERRLIAFDETRVRLSDIDLDGRQLLQNREEYEPDADTVDDYTAAWLRGDPLPAVILWEQSAGSYVPIDGYTRSTSALRAGLEEIDAVIAKCDRRTAEQLAVEANARHGRRADRRWLLSSAVKLAEEGMSVKEAAIRTNVAEHAITERRAIARALRRGQEMKITRIDRLPEKVLEKLASIDMDGPFRALAELARDGNLKPTKVDELKRDLKQARSEPDQIAMVEAARAELGVSVADEQTEKMALPFKRFVGQVAKLRSIDTADVVKAAHMSGKAREEADDLATRLREIVVAYEAAVEDIYG